MFNIEKIKNVLNIGHKIFTNPDAKDILKNVKISNAKELEQKQKKLEQSLYDTSEKEKLEKYKRKMYDSLKEKININKDYVEVYDHKVPKESTLYSGINLYYTDIVNNYTKLVMSDKCNSEDYVNGVYSSCVLRIDEFGDLIKSLNTIYNIDL